MEVAGERDVWFNHRIAEVHEHIASWRRRGIEVDQLHHWPAGNNPAGITAEGEELYRTYSRTGGRNLVRRAS